MSDNVTETSQRCLHDGVTLWGNCDPIAAPHTEITMTSQSDLTLWVHCELMMRLLIMTSQYDLAVTHSWPPHSELTRWGHCDPTATPHTEITMTSQSDLTIWPSCDPFLNASQWAHMVRSLWPHSYLTHWDHYDLMIRPHTVSSLWAHDEMAHFVIISNIDGTMWSYWLMNCIGFDYRQYYFTKTG